MTNILDIINKLPKERQEKILKDAEKLLEQQEDYKKLFQIYNLINLTSSIFINSYPIEDEIREEYYNNLASIIFSDNIYQWINKKYPEMKNYYKFNDSAKEDEVKMFSRALERYIHDNIDKDYDIPSKEHLEFIFSSIK